MAGGPEPEWHQEGEAAERAAPSSLLSILGAIWAGVRRLIRLELDLARQEGSRILRDLALGAILAVLAALLVLIAIGVLAAAMVLGLIAWGIPPFAAALICGVALLLIALAIVQRVLRLLGPGNLVPRRSLENIGRDIETLKDLVSRDGKSDE